MSRIMDITPLNDQDDEVVEAIKRGKDLPFNRYEEVETGLHFGDYEGAYYGQRYRNNQLGVVEAHTLNMRQFHYLIAPLGDGRILVGVSYHGQFGDYEGLRSVLSHRLMGNYQVSSKSIKSVSSEIGAGVPISLKLGYRKSSDRAERKPLFGSTGVIAISNSEFGSSFEERVSEVSQQVRGTAKQKRKALSKFVNDGELLELNEDDIVDCSVVVRDNGRLRTVYFLGDNNFSTKFPLLVGVNSEGAADRDAVKREMIRVMREEIVPLIALD